MNKVKSKKNYKHENHKKDKIKIKLNANKIMQEFMDERNHNLPLEQLFGERSRYNPNQGYDNVSFE